MKKIKARKGGVSHHKPTLEDFFKGLPKREMKYPVNTILHTKDGRKCGNAIVIDHGCTFIKTASVGFSCTASLGIDDPNGPRYYNIVKTDYGTEMKLNDIEVEELFYIASQNSLPPGMPVPEHKYSVSNRQAFIPSQLINLLNRIHFDSVSAPYLIAGFCVVSQFAKDLWMRPHLWINGLPGSGKSFLINEIMNKLIEDPIRAIEFSYAGLLMEVSNNSGVPVLLDLDESVSRENIDAVISLAKAAHSDGFIVKGSKSGKLKSYSLKSSFAIAANDNKSMLDSDLSRFSVIEIKDVNKAPGFMTFYNECITESFCRKFKNHALDSQNIVVLNSHLFESALSSNVSDLDNLRSTRAISLLCAGAYSLFSDELITMPEAKKFIEKMEI